MGVEITTRDAVMSDVEYIAARMRRADRAECVAQGLAPHTALKLSFEASDHVLTSCVDGRPAMMFGANGSNVEPGCGVWALGTDECSNYPVRMVRFGRAGVAMFKEEFGGECHAWCHSRYVAALRWLEMIGFRMAGAKVISDRTGELFYFMTTDRRRFV